VFCTGHLISMVFFDILKGNLSGRMVGSIVGNGRIRNIMGTELVLILPDGLYSMEYGKTIIQSWLHHRLHRKKL